MLLLLQDVHQIGQQLRPFTTDCGTVERAGGGTSGNLELTYGILPVLYFQTGNSKYDVLGLRGIASLIHPNYVKGKESKIKMLTRLGLWRDPRNAYSAFLCK